MTAGLAWHPEGTLIDRALHYLSSGPADSPALTHRVLGIPVATGLVSERLAVALLGADPRVGRLADGRWVLIAPAPSVPSLEESSFAVVDVETTGGRAGRGDRITEIAVVVVRGSQVELLYDSLINPGRPIPWAVTRVTDITDDMVRHRPSFADIADEVLAVLSGRIFVAHNLSFDWRFISSELRSTRGLGLIGPKLCTVKLARRLLPALKSRSLDSLAFYFGIEIERRHRAGPDALATGRILQRLLELAQEAGAATPRDLSELSRRRAPRRRGRRERPESMGEL